MMRWYIYVVIVVSLLIQSCSKTTPVTPSTAEDEFIAFILDDESYGFFDRGQSMSGYQINQRTVIYGVSAVGGMQLQIEIDGTTIGTHSIIGSYSRFNEFESSFEDGRLLMNATFTSYGVNEGEYIEGNFAGTFEDEDLQSHFIRDGSFRVKI